MTGHAAGRRTEPDGQFVTMLGGRYYRIGHSDRMPPFFMTVVSSADHWIFVSSTGGLSAGRVSAESAVFPYYTDDKITESVATTGPVSCLFVTRDGRTSRWEPFATAMVEDDAVERNLYKNVPGDSLVFEEVHQELGLTFRYAWRSSDRFGLVRTVWLRNDLQQHCSVRVLDGVRNILPSGASTLVQATLSNLLDAYKRNELDEDTGLGLFTLSAALTDRAEPSESLRANVAWQVGLTDPIHLLSTHQLDAFRRGDPVVPERDVKGSRGAYLLCTDLDLSGREEREWSLVLDVDQDHAQIAALRNLLRGDPAEPAGLLAADIARGTDGLTALVASADGLQVSSDRLTTAHHFANVEFNIMRGGVFADGDRIDVADLLRFVGVRRPGLLDQEADFFGALPRTLSVDELRDRVTGSDNADLVRLCLEYLPLTFSRRHGDPSRPWNRFAINLRHPDGSRRLDYQGNWRDIFQNWEPLAWSFPGFVEGMVAAFVNATTVDGYNPYRVTRDGIEWETPEPDNPWANIGYWSDHQIIYLQKLLETSARFHPDRLAGLLAEQVLAYADVPYRIRPYEDVLADPYDTIDFDVDRERVVADRVAAVGTDGRLLVDGEGRVVHVCLAEKLLLLMLVKLTNLVPEGGIWMNTQRPEWNDANNALVGKGLSVVTTAYLRRMLRFCRTLMAAGESPLPLTPEVADLLAGVSETLRRYESALVGGFDDAIRRAVMDDLGRLGSEYRWGVYRSGLSEQRIPVPVRDVLALLDRAIGFVDQTLRANRRDDGLFHSYNILRLDPSSAGVGHLYPMLEGQVAILSSGLLEPPDALALLRALRASVLYRADQHSYLLYPDRDLPGFLAKNRITADQVGGIPLVETLIERDDRTVITRDDDGVLHFHGDLHNARGVLDLLEQFRLDADLAHLVDEDGPRVVELFESVFDHASFTGRSGTFFAFEGLGSIYWHMVSKLLLAVQENYWWARSSGADDTTLAGLADAYYDIRAGLGFNKSPAVYGAFPTDPYSHTPKDQGAKQPGMTGQVKEEILTRLGELGVHVSDGCLSFDPALLRVEELLTETTDFPYRDVDGESAVLIVPAGGLAFTVCQTPVVLVPGPQPDAGIDVVFSDGGVEQVSGNRLGPDLSGSIFRREGRVRMLTVHVPATGAALPSPRR